LTFAARFSIVADEVTKTMQVKETSRYSLVGDSAGQELSIESAPASGTAQ
jgi:hypothetical protein